MAKQADPTLVELVITGGVFDCPKCYEVEFTLTWRENTHNSCIILALDLYYIALV